MKTPFLRAILWLSLSTLALAGGPAVKTYTVTDLGTFGGPARPAHSKLSWREPPSQPSKSFHWAVDSSRRAWCGGIPLGTAHLAVNSFALAVNG